MSTNPELDGTDFEILELLRLDSRRSFADIAKRVSLSPSAVKRRIDRLTETGVIVGFSVNINHAKLGQPIEAFTELRFAGDTKVAEIKGIAQSVPEIQAVYTIAGDPDALVRIRVKDLADLARVVDLLRRSGRVVGTKTLMVLDAVAPERGLGKPVDSLNQA